jgi:hypothetical protein
MRDANIMLKVDGLDEALSKAKELVLTLERAVELSEKISTSQAALALQKQKTPLPQP